MKSLFGGLLLAVGLLIAGASGLCSLVFLFSTVGNDAGGAVIFLLPFVAVIGGVPFSIGFLIILWGRFLLRQARVEEE